MKGINQMKNLLVLDGNSIINRAFYGVHGLTKSDGTPTNAIYGFINIVTRHIDRLKPDYMICTFDTHLPTFRHGQYDKYKSNRKGMPDDLAFQLPYVKNIVSALGFTVLECQGYEADDIIGTVCRSADAEKDIYSYILTGDRDSLQLISKTTSVILMRNKGDELFDEEHFFEVYGVSSSQFADVKALMGDSSDCIPGVPGIGEKTALKLISAAGSLDNLYDNCKDGYFGSTPSVCKKLDAGRESAYMSRELATICCNAPVGGDIGSYTAREKDRKALYKIFKDLEFENFIRKFDLHNESPAPDLQKKDLGIREISSDELAKCTITEQIPIAVRGDSVALLCGDEILVCSEAGADALKNVFAHKIICYDYKELFKKLIPLKIIPICSMDIMLAKYLIDPGKNTYPLSYIAETCGLEVPESLTDEVSIIAVCAEKFADELEKLDMLKLMQDIEIPLAETLAEAELIGFKIDRGGIKEYARQLLETENELAASIYSLAGHDFNINSPKQLGHVLFEELELPSVKKTKTGYSTNAETLQKLKFYHPIISEILSYRHVSKLRGTYGDTLADMADEKDRIHTSFNQCGTATGRLSSNDPNLQNIPVRGELGREIRKYFTSENSSYVLIDADYSQIELRLLAHLSGDETMISAFNSGIDIHTVTASQVFRIPPEEVTHELRLRAKAVNFGIVYGIGAFSLSQDIGCTKKQADEYIKSYFETYPKVYAYLNKTVEEAVDIGYTATMFGRRRKIPELKSSNKNVAAFGKRVAMNSPIQGTAADIIKIAMIEVSRALKNSGIDARLIMQVHDELIVEASIECADEAKKILVEKMESAATLSVPLLAEAGVGYNWFTAK